MAKPREPMKFDPAEWRADLRNCWAPARGLWMEMLCIMHEAQPYGHLLIDSRAPTDRELAIRSLALPVSQLPELLGELEAAGVFSRTREGVIYSPRMVCDEKGRQTARRNGKSGGNPSLRKTTGNSASDKRPEGRQRVGKQRAE